MSDVTVSHHFLRRRAREHERKLQRRAKEAAHLAAINGVAVQVKEPVFRVEKAQRGPYRWRVVRVD